MLTITVIYLDKYHGKEWPPSPFRLFQAIIAAAKSGRRRTEWTPEKEKAMRWFESLSPPLIVATSARLAPSYSLSVRNNDMDVAAKEWCADKEPNLAKLRTMKPVKPWWPECGRLAVQYRWTLQPGEDAEEHLNIIREEARHITHLGWGIDMVAVSAENSQPLADGFVWQPEISKRASGVELRCPQEGSFADLEDGYQQICNRWETYDYTWYPTVWKKVCYICETLVASRPWTAFLLLRLTDEHPAAWNDANQIVIAAMTRHAVNEFFENQGYPESWRRTYVQGHGETEEEKNSRLSYIPLPSIGHKHADGRIRRMLVVGSPGSDRDILDLVQWGLPEHVLSKDGVPCVRLMNQEKSDGVLRRYTGAGHTWMSVTPVILPAYGDPAEAIFRAMEHVGIDPAAVEDVWYQKMPFWPGSSPSWCYKVASYMDHPRYHVKVRFRKPITGPLILGRGRHYGLGVMAVE